MKGDFTRSTFQAKKNYSSVRLQQGRVQLDADWNEQVDIQAHHDQTTIRDVVGPSGTPHSLPGEFKNFEIRAVGKDFEIADGRIYVDGILCENDAVVLGSSQPNLFSVSGAPMARRPDGTLETLPPAAGTYLAYLDVWQRDITALEDPSIREDALGGPDTATRTKTIWQVFLLRVSDGFNGINCLSSFSEWDDLIAGSTGKLRARAQPGQTSENPCDVGPGGGYRGLENRLYRVEIHKGGPHGTATFKWSRDNACVVFSIDQFVPGEPKKVIVSRLGRDQVLALSVGDWVEVTGDDSELNGEPGTLTKIQDIDHARRVLTLEDDVSGYKEQQHHKVRRWDMPESDELIVETPTTNGGYLSLEDGIEVRFDPGYYRSGDYWQIPARTLKADIEWPQEQGAGPGHPAARAPQGIKHHFCRLALLRVDNRGNLAMLDDCRQLFLPLTELPKTGDIIDGIHVQDVRTIASDISLTNDTNLPVSLLAEGLRVVCDAPVDEVTIGDKPTCIVTLDLPFPFSNGDKQLWGEEVVGYQPLILRAEVETDGETIVWRPADESMKTWLFETLFEQMAKQARGDRILAHLTLKGNFIWRKEDPDVYLDGDVFGVPNEGATIGLDLPSGDRRRGGDFEMWFWLVSGKVPGAALSLLLERDVDTSAALSLLLEQDVDTSATLSSYVVGGG